MVSPGLTINLRRLLPAVVSFPPVSVNLRFVPLSVTALIAHVLPKFTLDCTSELLESVHVLVSEVTTRFASIVPLALPLTVPLVVYENVWPATVIAEPPAGVLKLPLAPLTWTTVPLLQPDGM